MRLLISSGTVAALLSLGVFFVPPASAQSENDAEDCAMCHEEVVADFARTPHAVAPGWDPAAGCRACHGDGTAHMDEGGDSELIVRPQQLPTREASAICLDCHQREAQHFSARQSIHRLNDVGCLDCHDAHAAAEHLIPQTNLELCSQCHQSTRAQFELPRHHPLGSDGPACGQCHEPHAARTVRTSRPDYERLCGSCHFEKVGPFVYNHDTQMVDGCLACHENHGSTNRHLLRHESQVNLCYECHSAASTPGWHSAAQYANRKCTACHVAIHGSNTDQFLLEN